MTGVFKRLRDRYPTRLNLETHTPATTILYDDTTNPAYPYAVVTPRGIVRAATLVHCNNGHAGHLLPQLRGKIHPIRGTMSAQRPAGNGAFPDMTNTRSWTFLSDMHYDRGAGTVKLGWFYGLQNPPRGDVWIGGEDKRVEEVFTADDSTIGALGRRNLANILPTVFNDRWVPSSSSQRSKPEILGMWTGVMAQTGDTVPFVGRLPACATGRPRGESEYIAAGWNSYGMTNGLTSGEAVAKMILGEQPPAWFPEAYLPTEERLGGLVMQSEEVVKRFLVDSGIGPTLEDEGEAGMVKAKL